MASDKLKDNYIVVQSWMVRDLALKGNRLVIYAIIYGFSQTEKQLCTCGIEYLQAWTNSTKQGILNTLDSLEADGLIERVENPCGDKRKTAYRIKLGQQSLPNSAEIGQQSLPKLGQESLPISEKKVKKVDLNRSTKFTELGQQSCRASDNNKNNKYIFVVDEETRARVGELASLITIDCKPTHSQEEYAKAAEELKHSDFARKRYTHLSKIHAAWGRLITGSYRNYKNTTAPATTNFAADQINAAFAALNEEL